MSEPKIIACPDCGGNHGKWSCPNCGFEVNGVKMTEDGFNDWMRSIPSSRSPGCYQSPAMNREIAIEKLGIPNRDNRHQNTQMCKQFGGPSFLFDHVRKVVDISKPATPIQLIAAAWWLENECD